MSIKNSASETATKPAQPNIIEFTLNMKGMLRLSCKLQLQKIACTIYQSVSWLFTNEVIRIFYESTPVTINMAAIIKITKTTTIRIITELGLVYLSFSIQYSLGINKIPTWLGRVLVQQIQA